jgi:Ca2+-binding RTX toxin-like protein/predicted extracellular nuclease
MKSKLLATRLGHQNPSDFLESLRSDSWLGSGFGRVSVSPASQPAAAPDLNPATIVAAGPINSSSPAWSLASGSFMQNWTTTTLITVDDNWAGVPAIVGYRGDDITTATGTDPRTLTANDTGLVVDVIANQANPNTQATGGVAEFDGIANPTIALQGSGTADAPYLVIYLDSTGRENVRFQCNLRDIDGSADNSAQQVNIQYRTSPGGTWTNVTGGYFADVSTGPSLATAVTAVDVTLPAGAANSPTLEIRIMTTNAVGNDEWVGIDDIVVSSTAVGGETQTVQFNPISVTHDEGNSGTTAYTFTVTRTGGSTGQLNFSGTIAAGSTDNADYVGGTAPTVFSGSILAGQTSATVTVNIQGDFTIEGNESFTLTLTSVSNTDGTVTANIGANLTGTGNITNDDAAGTISVDDVSLAEGNAGTTAGSFAVHRTGATGTVTVDYVITLPGGAGGADGSDVSGPLTGTVTFLEGETSASIPFTINGDVTNEPNETFTVALSNATGGATIGDGAATATITNDDAAPTISIGDASLVEGDDGVTYLVFTVTLSKVSIDPVTVDFDTSDGSAVEDSDYLGVTGQVSFAPGDTSETISVPLIGDEAPENNETLIVTLSNPAGATIADGSATGTIANDDGAGYYSLAGGSFTQNWTNTGLITAADNWSGVPYIIGYLGDIDAGSSTNVDPRTLTAANLGAIDVIANQSSTAITNGGVAEFEIANPVVGLQGSGTADAPSLVLYMDATGRSSVRLQANIRDIDATSDDAAQQVNVQYRTSPGGAWTNVPGGYFADVTTAGSATQVTALDVTLPAGADNSATLEIRIMTTNAGGNDEWVGIDDIVVSSQTAGPSLSIANAAVFEGDAGPTIITFTVTRAGDSTGAVTADYAVAFGSGPFDANADDFTALSPLSGQVSFADGETSATITLSVDGDVGPEGDENFTVLLSNPSAGATISDGSATGTIVNDDGTPPLVTINDVTITEGNAGTSLMTFTVTRTGGTGAFDVDWETADGSATQPSDYIANSGTIHFAMGQMSDTVTVAVTVNGDTDPELSETLRVLLSNATNFALITDGEGIGTIAADDPLYIHMIQGTSYFSPILAGEGITSFNTASAGTVIVRAIVTAVDNDGPRQGFYIQEEVTDWDSNNFTSEGIFVMTRNDAGVGTVVSGVSVGDLVTVTAHVMEYQGFANNMPITALTSPSSIVVNSTGNALPNLVLDAGHPMPTAIMTLVQPDYTDSADGVGDTFDASLYALSFWETVEGMLVTIPDMVVADGFVSTSGGQPIFQAYSQVHADADQINSRGGYTIAGDPPVGPPDTAGTEDDTIAGGRHLSDGDVNPDIIEIDFTGFAIDAPAGLTASASMGDELGDVTGIIDFDFTDRKLFVTGIDPGSFVDHTTTQDVTVLGDDSRSLTVATFNVENLDPTDPLSKFQGLAQAIATNLNMPDIISIEEMQDNNGAAAGDGISPTGTDASTTWQMLVDALNTLTGAHYQWVDEAPIYNAEGGEQSGNIRVGFLYNTDRVQLGDLDPDATLAERRMYTDRIGDGVRDAGDLIAFSDNMLGAEIQTGDWANTRRSLLGEFTFNGNKVYVTANHFPAKGGSDEFWQFNQNPAAGEPTNAGWTQRNNVAQDVYAMLDLIETGAPGSGIVSGGDYNDFYFYRPLTTVTGYTLADGTARVGGSRFDNLTLTLPEAERYTYNFDGRSQAIDHIVVNGMLSAVATYDVVHLNTGFNSSDPTPLSDHDPGLSSFDFRSLSEVLFGTAGADTINGFGGNDVIVGLGGDDVMTGGPGDDTFYVDSAGDVVIEAIGEGTDRVATSVTYILATGTEIEILEAITLSDTGAMDLQGNEFANRIIGNNGVNILRGQGANDVLIALDGADYLVGGTGDDAMYGGAGNDTYYVDSAGDTVSEAAGEGTDRVAASASYTLAAGSEVESLEAVDFAATNAMNLTGNEFANAIVGNAGANALDGRGGADVMSGGDGDDVYYVDNAGDVVNEETGRGIDRVAAAVSYVLSAGASVETLEAINQAASTAIDLTGSDTANVIRGNQGANILNGAGGDDIIDAFAGNDVLIGGAGKDFMYGGTGDDTYYVDSDDIVTEAVGEGTDRIAASSSFVLNQEQHVEIIEAINSADTTAINLTGSSFANRITGNAGANTLNGAAGDDVLIGLEGDDILDGGGFGNDLLIGGLGNDTYRVMDQGNVIIEAAGEGTDRVIASRSYALGAGVDIEFLEASGTFAVNLTGNALSQTITGNSSDNTIIGGGGEDDMSGLGGNDRYIVDSAGDVVHEAALGGGSDRISTTISYTLAAGVEVEILEALTSSGTDPLDLGGNEFVNSLIGTNGVNILDGGAGSDTLAGLGGADTFRFTTALGSNVDRIMDFVSGTDRIALDDAVFTGLAPGALPAGAFVIGTAAADADDRIIYDSTTGQLYYDADGNGGGAMVQFAILQLHPALAASDFIVI